MEIGDEFMAKYKSVYIVSKEMSSCSASTSLSQRLLIYFIYSSLLVISSFDGLD